MKDDFDSREQQAVVREIRYLELLLLIISLVAIGFVLYQLQQVLIPFAIAVFFSYLFKPLVVYLTEKRKFPMPLTIAVVLLIVAVIIFLFGFGVYSTIEAFIAALPRYQQRAESLLASFWDFIQQAGLYDYVSTANWKELLDIGSMSSFLSSSVGSLFTFFANVFLVLFFMVFILAGTGGMHSKIVQAFPRSDANRFQSIVQNIDTQIRKYLVTKTLISLVTGFFATIVLLFFDVDFALLWGVLTFLLNYIPNIGSIIATVFPVLFALIQFGNVGVALLLVVILTSIQMIMGNVVEPRVMGKTLNLSPLLVLTSLIFWGWLWGLVGMILSVPLVAIIKIIFENIPSLRPLAIFMGDVKNDTHLSSE